MLRINDTLGYMICKTARKVHRHIEKIFVPYGLTVEQWVAMKVLAENPDISQKTLSDIMEKDQNTVKAIVTRLMQKNYVQRTVNNVDRRAFFLNLTSEGSQLIEKLSVEDEAANRSLEHALGEGEAEQIKDILRQIEEVLKIK